MILVSQFVVLTEVSTMNMAIQLTEQQRQAIEVQRGEPVEVVDPITLQVYVLVAVETFDRIRSLVNGDTDQVPNPNGSPPGKSSGEGESDRVRLNDLPTPPEVLEEVERWCAKHGRRGREGKRAVEEKFKLQFHFGGRAIYLLNTPEGSVVLPIAERHRNTPDLRYVLLTADERPGACLTIPPRWRDTVGEILN